MIIRSRAIIGLTTDMSSMIAVFRMVDVVTVRTSIMMGLTGGGITGVIRKIFLLPRRKEKNTAVRISILWILIGGKSKY